MNGKNKKIVAATLVSAVVLVGLAPAVGLSLVGCGYLGNSGGDVSSSGPAGASDDAATEPKAASAPVKPGAAPLKEKGGIGGLIQAGVNQGMPPAPEAGITRKQCNDMQDGGPVDQYGVTGRVECGETIVGHTRGGVQAFDTRWYERNFCTPATTNHGGGDERIYRLRLPEGKQRAYVTFDSPCADLDVALIQWNDTALPGPQTNVSECDMNVKPGTNREGVEAVSDGSWRDWLIVVEGKDDEEGPFSVTVQCVNHL